MHGTEPRFQEVNVMKNTIPKRKRKINLDIMNILVVFRKIEKMEVFYITNPRYNEQISQVSWHFLYKSRFHLFFSFPQSREASRD